MENLSTFIETIRFLLEILVLKRYNDHLRKYGMAAHKKCAAFEKFIGAAVVTGSAQRPQFDEFAKKNIKILFHFSLREMLKGECYAEADN